MRRTAVTGVVGAIVLAVSVASAVTAGPTVVQRAKQATARFNSTVQAQRAGYGPFPPGVPLHECIMSLTVGDGGMGFHWVNGSLLDDRLDPAAPEVLVYAPKSNGRLKLVALEYVIFDSAVPDGTTPMIFGQPLTFVFADFNPNVTC